MAYRLQQLEWLTTTVLRTLARQPRWRFDLQHGRCAEGSPLPWNIPHLQIGTLDGLSTCRAVADSLGLRQRLTDPVTHRAHAPRENTARMLYEWFEQIRIESLVPEHLPGIQANLLRHFRRWSIAWHDSSLIDTHLGLLLFSVCQMLWARLQRLPSPEAVQDTMEATRAGIAHLLGEDLHTMARHRHEPGHFSPASARMACTIAALMHHAQQSAAQFPGTRHHGKNPFFLWRREEDSSGDHGLPLAATSNSRAWSKQDHRYRVFTHQFDQHREAICLIRPALLHEYRQEMNRRLHELSPPLARLGRDLMKRMASPTTADWRFLQTEGRIDGRQLARMVSSPLAGDIFRQEVRLPAPHCAITLLVDCSGSMKGYAMQLALFADIWTRVTDALQIPFEVLGFSTASWHGGKALAAWRRAGSPERPGRLAERLHLVFKNFENRGRRNRLAIACLLKQDLYREGLDGEAVQWAAQRLLHRDVQRRVLWVISDGCPMESATQQANDAWYLDSHLKAMVTAASSQGVEITGIGLGLNLSPFYPRHLAVTPDDLLQTRTLQALIKTLDCRQSRSGTSATLEHGHGNGIDDIDRACPS